MNRYHRHIILSEIGKKGQEKLAKAKVLVVGAGGLGCPVLQYLVAAGIGTVGIIDFDVVEESNLQRQILFGMSSLGKNKAVAAKERLMDLNPTVTLTAYEKKLDVHNALDMFKAYDIIVDGTDNFATRYLINDAAIVLGKPVVFGAIFKFEGQISVFNYKKGPSYRCLFPDPPQEGTVPNCSEIGVLGVLPGIIGTMQANEVLKLILGIGDVLSGRLYCYNALTLQSTILHIKRNEAVIQEIFRQSLDSGNYDNMYCDLTAPKIAVENVLQKENFQFIDVREFGEEPKINHLDVLSIPLSTLSDNVDKIDPRKTSIVFCQSGVRSIKAVQLLKAHKIDNCYSLEQGAAELLKITRKNKLYGNEI